eukprot:14077072-Alexandrium_andersonii.AAC.1
MSAPRWSGNSGHPNIRQFLGVLNACAPRSPGPAHSATRSRADPESANERFPGRAPEGTV